MKAEKRNEIAETVFTKHGFLTPCRLIANFVFGDKMKILPNAVNRKQK